MNPKIDRRRFLRLAVTSAPLLLAGDALALEPEWLKVETVRIGPGAPTHRLAHISDLHYKGDTDYLQDIVTRINALEPNFVCFTGDLVEKSKFLNAALEGLGRIRAPLYGVPGNHDFQAQLNFSAIDQCFTATGGGWLYNRVAQTRDGGIHLIGTGCNTEFVPTLMQAGLKNILLMHFPLFVEKLGTPRLDLILAGHSHGGQVRLPWVGALVLPDKVGKYEMGLYRTAAGPMYVNPGLGYMNLNVRFNCRPEITLIEI